MALKAGGNPNVFKEAAARKSGGKVCPPMKKDKPKRASGGRVGADKNPFSSAHRATKG